MERKRTAVMSSCPHDFAMCGRQVPWIAALTTYFSYAILFVFGTLRDCILYLNVYPTSSTSLPVSVWLMSGYLANLKMIFSRSVCILSSDASTPERKGYGKLLNDFQDFYTRRLYNRIQVRERERVRSGREGARAAEHRGEIVPARFTG